MQFPGSTWDTLNHLYDNAVRPLLARQLPEMEFRIENQFPNG